MNTPPNCRTETRFHSNTGRIGLRVLASTFLFAALAASGATQSWNPNGNGKGGNGAWNTGVTPDWDSGVVWTDSNDALFSGTGGTVTVFAPTANSLTFSATGPYLLTSGTLILSGSDVTVNSNATIASAVTSAGGLSVTGKGALTLTGASNLGGSLLIRGPGAVQITSGGTVSDTGGAVSGIATVTGIGSQWTSTGALSVGSSGTGTLAITNFGSVSDSAGYIGNSTGSTGVVSVSGAAATWTNTGDLVVGGSGAGTLAMSGDGDVSDADGYIGADRGGNGSVTVSGVGSTWINTGSLIVGSTGSGTLTINNGAYVTDETGGIIGNAKTGNGAVTVSGVGSTWTNAQNLYVGDSGSGTLVIENGGSVSVAGASYIGNPTGGNGSVTVSGSGSTWTTKLGLDVGQYGKGTLAISSGGVVSDAAAIVYYRGGVSVSGSGSTWTIGGSLSSQGGLAITNGGLVSDKGPTILYVGGAVTVSGSGSAWQSKGAIDVGASGAPTLVITDGGTVSTVGESYIEVREASGSVTVSGTGSTWTNDGNLVVGHESGSGTLAISGGGTVKIEGSSAIGDSYGGSGAATISGKGSEWTNTGDLSIGSGTLTIDGGGFVSDADGNLSGSAAISGPGSRWLNTNNLEIGGSVVISGGATVSDLNGYLGYAAGTSGTAMVSGPGSTWRNTRNLFIGSSGMGTLTVMDGGLVSVTGTTTIGREGTLQFDGGSSFNLGTLAVNGGTLRTLGGATFTQAAGLETARNDCRFRRVHLELLRPLERDRRACQDRRGNFDPFRLELLQWRHDDIRRYVGIG